MHPTRLPEKIAVAAAVLLLFLTISSNSKADQVFDVRQHLSSVARYAAVKDIVDNSFQPSHIPDGCTPSHLNLVVPRASASAVSFGMGLFSGNGSLGPGRHQAFAVTSESRASDITLRFFDCCQTYKDFRKEHEPAVDKLKEPIIAEITSALAKRYEFNFTRQDISSLWFLCKQAALLEWMDDLEGFILKGYGKSLNYQMGVPLLKYVIQSMDQAIVAREGNVTLSDSLLLFGIIGQDNQAPGYYEKARLRFAHAETVVPFSCFRGLSLEGSDFQRIQEEEPLDFPPKPPQKRNWRISTVAPFGGNNMLVLYSRPANSAGKYFVRVLHNEHPIQMPGCDGTDFCPFEVFKERVVLPHSKHDYNTLCKVNLDQPKQKPEPISRPFAVKLSLCCLKSNILRCEVEIGSEIGKLFVDNQSSLRCEVELVRPFVVELNLCCLEWHDILRRGVEIAGDPFVVKLSLDLDILRCEVEIQALYVRREDETMDDPFIVKFSFELDIFRREVKIYSRANRVALSSISFAVKLKLTLTETGKLFCCQTVATLL
ncbi:Histidine acid phosphatase family protein isoform 2 [Hibiscus syriacus]|uniref:Multiple inositol polyphosphate phosphatase 1 n=1 Tax=Hibiscus syriacus TaxID=106335 RepID=A0A6A2ZUU5_HIBSY|nr:Histidine acid phosphatase family protein isoform 2 [Hibiscus syriacus]